MIKLEKFKILDEMTPEQKLARAIIDLRKIKPFYSAIFECIKKEEANDITQTMAVSIDKIFYNTDYIDTLTYGEFLFVVLHELAHIGLKHVARTGKRDQKTWNIACDFYVNEMLINEFGLVRREKEEELSITVCEGLPISMPPNLINWSLVNLDTDSVEIIYEALINQTPQEGQSKPNEPNDDNNQSNEPNGDNNQSNEPNGDNNQSNDEENHNKTYTYKLRKTTTNANGEITDHRYDLVFDESAFVNDMIIAEDEKIANQKIQDILTSAKVKCDINNPGAEHGLLYKYAVRELNSKVRWDSLLKKYLRASTESDTSFSTPDKRFVYRDKMIIPGRFEEDLTLIEGVKVCIDISASIKESDLSGFLGQVWRICKNFKVSAEVIYWDIDITSKGVFTGYKEFERVNQIGGGGTDPACIFDYFNSKECKDKPIVNLIFTDGYIEDMYNTPQNQKKYKKNTIWVMSKDANKEFKPGFGKVVYPTWLN